MTYIGISQNFLIKDQYIKNYQLLLKRQNSFQEYLNFIDNCYSQYLKFITSSCREQKSQQFKQKNPVFFQFKSILDSFMNLFKEMIVYQQKQIQKLRKENTPSQLIDNFRNLIQDLELYEPMQVSYQKNIQKLYIKSHQLEQTLKKLKELLNQPINWYSINYRKKCYNKLLEEFKTLQNLQNQINESTPKMINKRESFYSQIQKFRRIATYHNQEILNRFKQVSKSKIQYFLVIFYILKQNLKNDGNQFNKRVMNSEDNIKVPRSKYQKSKTKDSVVEFQKYSQNFISEITKLTDLYNKNLAIIIRYLQIIHTNLGVFNKQFKNTIQKYKTLILYNINTRFQIKSSPFQYLKQTFLCFEISTFKFLELEQIIVPFIKDLAQISQNLKKHSEISISLLKTSNQQFNRKSEKTLSESNKQIRYHTELFQAMIKNRQLKNILSKVLLIVQNKIKEIVEWSQQKFEIKKKKKKNVYLQDSLYMTVYDDQNQNEIKEQKLDQTEWLYQDDQRLYVLQELNIQQLSKSIQQFKINENQQDPRQLQYFQASLIINIIPKAGKIILTQKYIKFNQQNNEIELKIPIKDIESIKIKSRIFNYKILQIETKKGFITFEKINDINKYKKLIQEIMDNQNQKIIQKVIEKPKAIALDQSELAIIELRKQKISKKLIDIHKLDMQLGSLVLNDISIEDVYHEIYSDQQKIIDGKKYQCFFTYYQYKLNNFKVTITKYNPKGPKFYTQHYQINFTNCQLYSQRILEYEHILPKMPIPFMPKTCHVKQIHKLYWISNEEFHLYSVSYTSGTPYASSILSNVLHKITKNEKNVKIQVKAGIQFLQQPLVKSILKQKAEVEIRIGGQNIIKLIKQRMTKIKNKSEQKHNNIKQNEKQQLIEKIKASQIILKQSNRDLARQLDELKKFKKNMIMVSILIILFSILLKLL